jgi:hypothetical protein
MDEELAWFAIGWIVGCFAALGRTLRDSDYRTPGRFVGAVCCGGFFAVSCVGILASHFPGVFANRNYGLAVASLIGVMGKDGERFAMWLLQLIIKNKISIVAKRDDE